MAFGRVLMMRLVSTISVLLCGTMAHAGAVLHVDDDAPAGGDGVTWNTAYRFLQDALAYASIPDHGVSEIRVAQGTYLPDRDELNPDGTGDRAASFQLINGVTLAGGYAGLGAPDPDARDVELHETILSGDLSGDDDQASGDSCCIPHDGPGCADSACLSEVCNYSSYCCDVAWDAMCVAKAALFCELSCPELETNSLHVISGAGTDGTAVLDGFFITAAYADLGPEGSGGGVSCGDGAPTVSCCRFFRNFADSGGAIHAGDGGAPTIESCRFVENIAFSLGGAVAAADGGQVLVLGSEFVGNGALSGGGVYGNDAMVTVVNCTFTDNSADMGGALHQFHGMLDVTGCEFVESYADVMGGAMMCWSCESELKRCRFFENTVRGDGGAVKIQNGVLLAANCLFNGNVAAGSNGEGGAIILDGLWSAGARIVNCTFADDSAGGTGGGLFIDAEDPVTVANCIFWGNTASGGDVEADQVAIAGGVASGLELTYSCVQGLTGALGGYGNLGDDPLFVDADGKDGIPGTEDDDLHLTDGSPCVNRGNDNVGVDLDLFDADGSLRTQQCRVDLGAFESPYFAADCNANGIADACDLVEGMSTDCNQNGIPDDCDIAGVLGRDCNDNGLPDECDVVPDLYRVDDGTTEVDVHGNGGDLIWFNEFVSVRDNEVIVAVDLCWGDVAEGTPTDIAIWVDPNDDGDPIDALLVALVSDVPVVNPETGMLNTIPVPPTFVGHTGEVFYVGAHLADGPSDYPACVDQDWPHQRRSWAAIGDNLNQLWANTIPPVILDDNCPECAGNWLIRARRVGSDDVDGNGIPDECDQCPWDLDASGDIGVGDFLLLLAVWGSDPGGPPDFDGNGDVGVEDFLVLLANWGACP